MGASPNPPASARDLKGMVLQNRAKRRQWRKRSIRGGTQRRILLKRRAVLEGSRRLRSDGVMRRVRTLKSLVPNGQSMGLDGLFAETAYLHHVVQMRVKVMKTMVNSLSTCD
ncbi:Transcription factor UPBEAT1 [Vitis vinifera]|uniref:Transcription factor UPBEAT1 n=1 Tax=Vitis vinifera TaxID=29760 RepID=A0A438GHC1_VITVI|nr:Transcription factor UPBEAT1 [Vitis vinifera]